MALDELEIKWGEQYPVVLQSRRRKWMNLSGYFRYPMTKVYWLQGGELRSLLGLSMAPRRGRCKQRSNLFPTDLSPESLI